MKLADWLFLNSVTPRQLRRMLGVNTRSTIHRYLTNKRVPRPHTLQRIIEITGGQVQLRDFLDPNPPECATETKQSDGSLKWVFPWHEMPNETEGTPDPKNETPQSRLSPPLLLAIRVLEGRAWYTPAGVFLLDGRVSDPKRIVAAANEILETNGDRLIKYPIVRPKHD